MKKRKVSWAAFLILSTLWVISEGYLEFLGAPEWVLNIYILLYFYFGSWAMVKPINAIFEKYFGPDGLYVPEEAVIYRYSFMVGDLNVCLFPIGKRLTKDL